jgi:hypothetical protein
MNNKSDYLKNYRLKNKDKIKQYYREYRNKNREKYKEYAKKFLERHPDYYRTAHYRELKHRYYLNNSKYKNIGEIKTYIIDTTKNKDKINNLIINYAKQIKSNHKNNNKIDIENERDYYLKHYYYNEDYDSISSDNWENGKGENE